MTGVLVRGAGRMGRPGGMPLWQRQSAGESRWAWTEAVGVGRTTLRSARQPLVPQMTELLVQLALILI